MSKYLIKPVNELIQKM